MGADEGDIEVGENEGVDGFIVGVLDGDILIVGTADVGTIVGSVEIVGI